MIGRCVNAINAEACVKTLTGLLPGANKIIKIEQCYIYAQVARFGRIYTQATY